MSAIQRHRNTLIDALNVALNRYEHLSKMAKGDVERRIWLSFLEDAKAALKALQDEEPE